MKHPIHIGIGLLAIGMCVGPLRAATATAEIKGTDPSSTIKGTVTLEDTSGGMQVKAQLIHVPPGQHGFHIHEFGSCADQAKAAGSHYNPTGAQHGMVMKDGVKNAHAGDMGNITADQSGSATLSALIPGVTVTGGQYTVGGRAIVLHEKADDFGQPVGNAGGRIGCGPILLTSSTSK